MGPWFSVESIEVNFGREKKKRKCLFDETGSFEVNQTQNFLAPKRIIYCD
jgi:hypothetical protein